MFVFLLEKNPFTTIYLHLIAMICFSKLDTHKQKPLPLRAITPNLVENTIPKHPFHVESIFMHKQSITNIVHKFKTIEEACNLFGIYLAG